MTDTAELVKLYGAVLDLCRVRESETLAVLTEDGLRGSDIAGQARRRRPQPTPAHQTSHSA
jgi:hypothetical protein